MQNGPLGPPNQEEKLSLPGALPEAGMRSGCSGKEGELSSGQAMDALGAFLPVAGETLSSEVRLLRPGVPTEFWDLHKVCVKESQVIESSRRGAREEKGRFWMRFGMRS